MKEVIGVNEIILPWIYLLANLQGAVFFIRTSSLKGWSKGELLVGVGAVLSLFIRIYWILFERRAEVLSSGATGRGFWYAQALAEYLSILCFCCGAAAIYFRAAKLCRASSAPSCEDQR